MLVKWCIDLFNEGIYLLKCKWNYEETFLIIFTELLAIILFIPCCVIDILLSPLEIITFIICKNR